MGCDAGYFISTRHANRLLAAYREPFLDAAKLTDEVKAILMDQDHDKTTREWEEFIAKAKVMWHVLEEERGGCQARIIR